MGIDSNLLLFKLKNFHRRILKSAFISKEILNEYSLQWQQTIPSWIKILASNKTIFLKDIPLALSSADLSIIRLALEHNIPIASDDRPLRVYAEKLGISIIKFSFYKSKIKPEIKF